MKLKFTRCPAHNMQCRVLRCLDEWFLTNKYIIFERNVELNLATEDVARPGTALVF